MKICPSLFQDKSVLSAHEILNGAESTFGQSHCNNAQVSADRVAEFPHAESFARRPGNSLNELERNQSDSGRPFTRLQGESAEMGQCLPTITVKNYSPLLRPSLNGYRPGPHVFSAKGRPSPGPGKRLPMVGFYLPNKRSRNEPSRTQHPAGQAMNKKFYGDRQKQKCLGLRVNTTNQTNGITKIAKFWGRQGTRGYVKGQKGT